MNTVGLDIMDIARWRRENPDFEKKDIKMEFVISLCTSGDIWVSLANVQNCLDELQTAQEIRDERIRIVDVLCSEIVEVKPTFENDPILEQLRTYAARHKWKWEQMLSKKEKYLKIKLIELRKKELEGDFE